MKSNEKCKQNTRIFVSVRACHAQRARNHAHDVHNPEHTHFSFTRAPNQYRFSLGFIRNLQFSAYYNESADFFFVL